MRKKISIAPMNMPWSCSRAISLELPARKSPSKHLPCPSKPDPSVLASPALRATGVFGFESGRSFVKAVTLLVALLILSPIHPRGFMS